MPAHIGIIDTLKISIASVAQFAPTKFNSKMGYLTPAEMYEMRKEHAESRNTTHKSYNAFRYHLNRFDPNKQAPVTSGKQIVVYLDAVDQNEWDLYLKSGTTFDNTVKAAFDKNEGWTITFVSKGSDARGQKQLKRIEAKGGKGRMSITLWSAKSSAADALAG